MVLRPYLALLRRYAAFFKCSVREANARARRAAPRENVSSWGGWDLPARGRRPDVRRIHRIPRQQGLGLLTILGAAFQCRSHPDCSSYHQQETGLMRDRATTYPDQGRRLICDCVWAGKRNKNNSAGAVCVCGQALANTGQARAGFQAQA